MDSHETASHYVASDYADRADRILSAIIGVVGDAVVAIDSGHRIIVFNRGAETMFGYRPDEVLGESLEVLLPREQLASHAGRVQRFAEEGNTTRRMADRQLVEGIRRDGTRFAAGATIASIHDRGEWIGVAIIRDISRHVETRQELEASLQQQERLARTDPLTGLWNRRALEDAIEREQARLKRGGAPFTVVYLDLDGFKPVNDRDGHAFGDRLLVETANAISSFFREMDFVARVGGDEFAILVPDSEAAAMASRLDQLRQRLRAVMRAHGVGVTVSIGALNCRTHCASVGLCLHGADTLMYEAKQTTRDAVVVGILDNGMVTDLEGRPRHPLAETTAAG